MALSTKELTTLLTLLSEDNVNHFNCTLEAIKGAFYRNFTRQDHFRVGTALTVLLQERDLLPQPAQRVAAIFLILELYHSEPVSSNPFAAFLAELLKPNIQDERTAVGLPCGHHLSPAEIYFIAELIQPSAPRDILLKKVPAHIAATDVVSLEAPKVDLLLATLLEKHGELPLTSTVGTSCLLSDPEPEIDSLTAHQSVTQIAETLLCTTTDSSVETPFEPGFVRPPPPLHKVEDEVTWLNPAGGQFDIKWDTAMCSPSSHQGGSGGSHLQNSELLELVGKAYKESLSIQQQQALKAKIDADPQFVHRIELTPDKLAALVENNPLIAIEALLCLLHSSQISEYLTALVNMNMSLHSMEVVNRLTTAADLPPEFIHLYISNCIQTCHKTKDKFMQSRLVRLVCVFLQSLIRNRLINVQDLFIEIETFCLDFNKIKEATALYKLIKTVVSGE
ncbi:CCR4-NOT transcription complex subunit 11-like [Dysidea avara]|uniref:CCR4-NOT transcription complex subunit 11-like n=1 Tax=Dysidea avara TaxID=196820 RepID=UPI0033246924